MAALAVGDGVIEPVDPAQLPSVRSLVLASAGAAALAALITVTAVLPAELGVDPTGVGTALGLTQLGQLKDGPPPPVAEHISTVDPGGFRSDEIVLTLQPGQGTEVKADLQPGDQVLWGWSADGPLRYDFHGEPVGGGADFTSYDQGAADHADGLFEAPFEGTHGWYWENQGTAPVTVTLKTAGAFASISHRP